MPFVGNPVNKGEEFTNSCYRQQMHRRFGKKDVPTLEVMFGWLRQKILTKYSNNFT